MTVPTVTPAWLAEVEARYRRKNKLLFTRDSLCLQPLLALIRQQSHRTLVVWAFDCVRGPLETLAAHLPGETRPQEAVRLCWQWAQGKLKMPPAKRALLEAHAVAKELSDPADSALCHAVGQACASVHVETHAIGLPLYELTALVLTHGLPQCAGPVEKKLAFYQQRLCHWQAHAGEQPGPWAPFLCTDAPNKEQRLYEKNHT